MRFVDSKRTIQQRVLSIKLLEKSLYGDALAAVVVETVFSVEQKSLKVRFNTDFLRSRMLAEFRLYQQNYFRWWQNLFI